MAMHFKSDLDCEIFPLLARIHLPVCAMANIWDFPKIGDPDIVPLTVGSL